jgi:hypothetical protein
MTLALLSETDRRRLQLRKVRRRIHAKQERAAARLVKVNLALRIETDPAEITYYRDRQAAEHVLLENLRRALEALRVR